MTEPAPTYTITPVDRQIVIDIAQALANIRAYILGRAKYADPLEQLAADEQLIEMIEDEVL